MHAAEIYIVGSVFTTHSPNATCVVVHEGIIVWIGFHETAQRLYPGAIIHDYPGSWLSPGCVDVLADNNLPKEHYHDLGWTTTAPQDNFIIINDTSPEELAAVYSRAEAEAKNLIFRLTDSAAVELYQAALQENRIQVPHSITMETDVPQELVSAAARQGISIHIVPGTITGTVHGGYLSQSGAIFTFGTLGYPGVSPWELVEKFRTHCAADSTITTRAAVHALTRNYWRTSFVSHQVSGYYGTTPEGIIKPGAVADFTVWEVAAMQSPVSGFHSVGRWSTDPRSGQPQVPDLGNKLPECITTVIGGRRTRC